jgi:pyrrolidone-carboxylate peptidase
MFFLFLGFEPFGDHTINASWVAVQVREFECSAWRIIRRSNLIGNT